MRCHFRLAVVAVLALSNLAAAQAPPAPPPTEPATPGAEPICLSCGDDLSGWIVWLKDSGHEDPQNVFSIQDGVIHVSGEGAGYLATRRTWRDYHLSLEYRWGEKTDGSGFVRNSGVLLHGTGAHGSARGVWMTSIECQLAQGCEGDLIVIRGQDRQGRVIPATVTSETRVAEDGRTRWQRGGQPVTYSGRQFWWSRHQPGFRERLDTRGRNDVASPLGKWTRVDCICRGDRILIKINGVDVNECYDVFPASGHILLQNEGNEIEFRNVMLRRLDEHNPASGSNSDAPQK